MESISFINIYLYSNSFATLLGFNPHSCNVIFSPFCLFGGFLYYMAENVLYQVLFDGILLIKENKGGR